MATAALVKSRLIMTFDGGVDPNGVAVVKRKSYNNLDPATTDDQIYSIAQALEPLQQYPIITVERDDATNITA